MGRDGWPRGVVCSESVPDVSPIQLIFLLLWALCFVGAYRLGQKGRWVLIILGVFVPPIWLAGFFWDAKPGSSWDRRNRQ
jgi:hypothetical protein